MLDTFATLLNMMLQGEWQCRRCSMAASKEPGVGQAQVAGRSEDLERRLKAQEDWKHSQDRSARSEVVWKQNQELFRLQQQNKVLSRHV